MDVDAKRLGVETYNSLKFEKYQDELGVFYLQDIDGTLVEPYLDEVGTEKKNGEKIVYGIVVGEDVKRVVTDTGISEPVRNAI